MGISATIIAFINFGRRCIELLYINNGISSERLPKTMPYKQAEDKTGFQLAETICRGRLPGAQLVHNGNNITLWEGDTHRINQVTEQVITATDLGKKRYKVWLVDELHTDAPGSIDNPIVIKVPKGVTFIPGCSVTDGKFRCA